MRKKYEIVTYSIIEEDNQLFWEEKWHKNVPEINEKLIGAIKTKLDVFRYNTLKANVIHLKRINEDLEKTVELLNKKIRLLNEKLRLMMDRKLLS